MKIRKANIDEFLEPTIRGLSLDSFRELLTKDIDYDLFLAPVEDKDKKDFYELYIDVKETNGGKRKKRGVLMAFRKGPKQFRLQAALNTIEREFPKAKDVRVLTREEAKKEMSWIRQGSPKKSQKTKSKK